MCRRQSERWRGRDVESFCFALVRFFLFTTRECLLTGCRRALLSSYWFAHGESRQQTPLRRARPPASSQNEAPRAKRILHGKPTALFSASENIFATNISARDGSAARDASGCVDHDPPRWRLWGLWRGGLERVASPTHPPPLLLSLCLPVEMSWIYSTLAERAFSSDQRFSSCLILAAGCNVHVCARREAQAAGWAAPHAFGRMHFETVSISIDTPYRMAFLHEELILSNYLWFASGPK